MAAEILLLMRDGAELLDSTEGRLLARTPDGEVALDGLTVGLRTALLRLNGEGASEDALAAEVIQSDGPAAAAYFYYTLANLQRHGLVAYRALGDSGALVTASSSNAFELLGPAAGTTTRCVLSRFALMRREGARLVLESALSSVRVAVEDPRVVALLARFSAPCTLRDLVHSPFSDEELAVLISLLLGCGVLTESGSAQRDDESGPLACWQFHDLLFHARSRLGRHHGGYGGTYRFRGLVEPLPATKPAMSEQSLELERPDLERLCREDVPFTAVLENRHSSRVFGDPPLHRRQVGEFLYRAARQRRTIDAAGGQELSSRIYPGGGSVYELEIYLSVGSCIDLPAGLYHYGPAEHRLYALPDRAGRGRMLLESSTLLPSQSPQVLLIIAARFARVFWKYESMGYAIILKDVGVLLQTMYLVAEAMGLGGCAVGGGDADLFAAAAKVDYYAETSVGEFIIGSSAAVSEKRSGGSSP